MQPVKRALLTSFKAKGNLGTPKRTKVIVVLTFSSFRTEYRYKSDRFRGGDRPPFKKKISIFPSKTERKKRAYTASNSFKKRFLPKIAPPLENHYIRVCVRL
jgi:hypothetical protein